MISFILTGRRAFPLLGAIVLAALLTVACDTWWIPSESTAIPATPTIEAPAQPSPTPEIKESPPEIVTPTPGPPLIEGSPYLRDTTPGAVIYYEPQIEYQTVGRVKDAFAAALNVLKQELDASPPDQVAIFLLGEDQFTRLGSAHGFPDTGYLLGFYSPSPQEGGGAAAGVYLNADGESLFHTLGHELTHAAVPGLPSWFSEGLADYIGTRVEKEMNPRKQMDRLQVYRRLVRDAVNDGALLDQKALESFDPRADHTCPELDRFYGQAWQLMEYVSKVYGPSALRGLVASYRDNTQSGDPFNTVLGIPVETVWQRFSTDIVANITPAERVAQSLDSLQLLATQAEAITYDWAQFIAQSNLGQPGNPRDILRGFGERWNYLAQQTAALAAPGPASSIRDLWQLYFQSMAQAMQDFAQGSDASASRRIAIANQAYSLAAASLRDSLLRRPSLSCD
ncbi:MAG: hypothetical protein Q7K03_09975 [Dehalococcoidia bacterium]|nr:hypothetical protein [Dehalococcoidia bacterium]